MSKINLPFAFEVKEISEDGSFKGYASVFGVQDLGRDIVAAGAFKRTLKEHRARKSMPKLLWQHNTDDPIGVWKSMEEDEKGLAVEGMLVREVQKGAEAYALLKAGAIDGLSIGYMPRKSKFDEESRIRTLTDVDLWEVSLVTFPMLPVAQVSQVKSVHEIKTIRQFEEYLRDAGFSAAQAKGIAAHGFKGVEARDEPTPDDELRELADRINRTTNLLKG